MLRKLTLKYPMKDTSFIIKIQCKIMRLLPHFICILYIIYRISVFSRLSSDHHLIILSHFIFFSFSLLSHIFFVYLAVIENRDIALSFHYGNSFLLEREREREKLMNDLYFSLSKKFLSIIHFHFFTICSALFSFFVISQES